MTLIVKWKTYFCSLPFSQCAAPVRLGSQVCRFLSKQYKTLIIVFIESASVDDFLLIYMAAVKKVIEIDLDDNILFLGLERLLDSVAENGQRKCV